MDIRSTTTSGARYRSIVASQGDPGYKATAVMLGEADGGVLTPAVALGAPYAERLRQHGVTLEVTKLG